MGTRVSFYKTQLVKESSRTYELANCPYDVIKVLPILLDTISLEDREHFVVLYLNTKHKVTGFETISIGALNASIVHPREVFKGALLGNAAAIICAHNHPSGDTTPSPEDYKVTQRLREAGSVLGIDLIDHIILGDNGRYHSFKEKGFFL